MPNMTLTKTPMPEQDPKVRARNFKEVALGYTEEMAREEAGRCLVSAAERDGETLLVRELLPDCPEAAAALADKLGCREAVFRTAGGTHPFGMAKSLDGTPLPQRAYLGPAFE